jgi:uncharacterized protein (DUF1778 family)
MPTVAKPKTRIDFRIRQETRDKIERAAMLRGKNLTDFAEEALERAADEVIASENTVTLSNRDRDRFLELLDNPRQPNEALATAALRYREMRGEMV